MLLLLIIHQLINHDWHHQCLELFHVEHLAAIRRIIDLLLALLDITLHAHVLVSLIDLVGVQSATPVGVHQCEQLADLLLHGFTSARVELFAHLRSVLLSALQVHAELVVREVTIIVQVEVVEGHTEVRLHESRQPHHLELLDELWLIQLAVAILVHVLEELVDAHGLFTHVLLETADNLLNGW